MEGDFAKALACYRVTLSKTNAEVEKEFVKKRIAIAERLMPPGEKN